MSRTGNASCISTASAEISKYAPVMASLSLFSSVTASRNTVGQQAADASPCQESPAYARIVGQAGINRRSGERLASVTPLSEMARVDRAANHPLRKEPTGPTSRGRIRFEI